MRTTHGVVTGGARAQVAQSVGQPSNPAPDSGTRPDASNLLIGAAVDRLGLSWSAATAAFETEIGASITVARRFISTAPSVWAAHGAFVADQGVRSSYISFKGSSISNSSLQTFLSSIPDDGYVRHVTWRHEPIDDSDLNPTNYKAKQAQLYAAWQAIGSPAHIVPTIILQCWPDTYGNGGTEDWYPDDPSVWELGMDNYSLQTPGDYDDIIEDLFTPTLTKWRAAGGIAWSICETGCHFTSTTAGTFVTDGIAWARTEGASGFMWFNSAVGADAIKPTGGWYLSLRGTEALAAFGAELA